MRIYMAACETNCVQQAKVAEHGFKWHAFLSYYNLCESKDPSPDARIGSFKKSLRSVVTDSGAFTFLGGAESGDQKRKHAVEFFERYFEWVKKYADQMDYFVELDVGQIVGYDLVLKWRERMRKAGVAEKCIIVYHGKDCEFSQFVREAEKWPSRYTGVESLPSLYAKTPDGQARKPLDYVKIIKAMYDRGIRVHGFAMTKPQYMRQVPFFSVDSASWKSALMFHRVPTYKWIGGGLNSFDLLRPETPKQRKMIAEMVMRTGTGNELYKKNKAGEYERSRCVAAIIGMHPYLELERDMTALWKARGVDWEARLEQAEKRSRKRKVAA